MVFSSTQILITTAEQNPNQYTMDPGHQKDYAVESSHSDPADDGMEMRNFSQLGGTDMDEQEMRTMGRTQQLNVRIQRCNALPVKSQLTYSQRNFRFISTLGFACTLMSTWEIALM